MNSVFRLDSVKPRMKLGRGVRIATDNESFSTAQHSDRDRSESHHKGRDRKEIIIFKKRKKNGEKKKEQGEL